MRRTRSNLGWIEGLPIEVVRGSYYDVDSLREAVGTSDYIFHIAGVTKARKPREYNDGNVLSTRNLLEAAASNSKLRKFCLISSQTATGPSPEGTLVDENSPCHPITTYGVTKLEAETICQLHSKQIPTVILRPPAVYGPRDRDILGIFEFVNKGIIPSFGSKDKRVSLIYGPELARGIVEATLSEKTIGQTYFVADQPVYSFFETLTLASEILGKRARSIVLPTWLLYGLAGISETVSVFQSNPPLLNIEKVRDLVQKNWTCNAKKIEEHIGFRTQVSLEEGIKRTLGWYKEHGWL